MEKKGGFYITQIKQLQDRIFEKMLADNGIEISRQYLKVSLKHTG